MRLSALWTLVAFTAVSSAAPSQADPWDALTANSLAKQAHYHNSDPNGGNNCNPHTASVRREWGSLSKIERKNYIDAALCLASKPSKSPRSFAPGARNRHDDFVATHINQTWYIHGTGNFLTWHRYFTWAYEQALRNECGYKGYQPYWAWNKYADDPLSSPLFDGSPYSISGNGAYILHNDTEIAPGVFIPSGSGGGCVEKGPFKNWVVNLGPVWSSLKVPGVESQNGSGLNYNPRCLRRDINIAAAEWTRTEIVMDLFKEKDIWGFETLLQGMVATPGYLGVHSGGHFTVGGDPGGDFYTSPGDPAFFLHHAAIDRLFWTWQNQDPVKRTYQVNGATGFWTPDGVSINATLDDVVDMGSFLAPPQTLRQLSDTTGGPFCYVYT
ncbi:tyrosinase family protein [Aspergillus melleus]|uniref:tyrosinase family protein n=1 Tax=Aspergillus melleus TaxID=138277 RepID=UPI001E8E7C17|nr:uncharacterized protein LDX57_010815 [Aspergillus melleus]KAH8433182.1 hypothetical protein LDX57_010815 [Aspergillus melleus]